MHRKIPHFFLLLFLFLVAASTANGQTILWSDEFNQPHLDENKWTREVGGGGFGNGELQYYTSGEQNVFIGSRTDPSDTGYLVIEARREAYGVSPERREFTSGRINTAGKFNFMYGTVEARIKLPDLQNGLWPAFWMLGANYAEDGWPASGEIDILEAGFQEDWQNNRANKVVHSTVHWFQDNYLELVPDAHAQGWYGNASATNDTTIAGALNDGFHTFTMEWTPQALKGYVDGIHFYTFEIPDDPNITEFNSHPYFLLLNLAIGGGNFVGITDPANITAPMPAQMQIDYVRVYSNQYTQSFFANDLPRETGTFGVYTETVATDASLGAEPEVQVWNSLVAGPATAPYEGRNALSFSAPPGDWFGMGIPTTNVRNMQNFIDGTLRFHMKTTSNQTFSIGVSSTFNGNAQAGTQAKTVDLSVDGNNFGLVRDGQWHEVVIPLSMFGNVEFRSINTMFYLVGDAPASTVDFALDNIYWVDGTKITPENGNFVLFSDTQSGVEAFEPGTDGDIYVWNNTLVEQASPAFEGSNVLSYTHNNLGWFGMAFTPNQVYNLSAFDNPNATLNISLKTSDTSTPFHIGMKSGTRDGEGQKWISFEPGQSPYGFQRNGTWQTIQIPMSDFAEGVDLMQVTQLFQILGTGNISDLAIDHIYFSGGTTAKKEDEGRNNQPPSINLTSPVANATFIAPASINMEAAASDVDGSVSLVEFFANGNKIGEDPSAPYSFGWTGVAEGSYSLTARATDNEGASTTSGAVTVVVESNSATGWPVPGTVQAEDFAAMNGIQLEGTSDAGGGQNVGWIDAGDWMDYEVNVTKAGSYTVSFRVASANGGGQLQLQSAGQSLASVAIPSTGGWQNWTTETATVNFSAGSQTLRVYAPAGGWNLNWIEFSENSVCSPTAITPYLSVNGGAWQQTSSATLDEGGTITFGPQAGSGGSWSWSGPNGFSSSTREVSISNIQTSQSGEYIITYINAEGCESSHTFSVTVNAVVQEGFPIPGIIQAEEYTAMNGVQLETTTDAGGGQNVGWIDAGDWMDYQVYVSSAGTYNIDFRVASANGGGQLQLQSGGQTLASVAVPSTGGWQNWTTVSTTATLAAGSQVIRLYAPAGGYNINWAEFTGGGSTGTGACTFTASTGDYTAEVSADASNPTITFIPSRNGVGSTTVILYYGTSATGGLAGYTVSANQPYQINAAEGETIYFYYTYNVPEGGERNTSASRHSFTVGNCSSSASMAARPTDKQLLEVQNDAFTAYPNPVQQYLFFRHAEEWKGGLFAIYDNAGRLLRAGSFTGGKLDVSSLATGTYTISLLKDDSRKFVRFLKK